MTHLPTTALDRQRKNLLTKLVRNALPPLGATSEESDPMAVAKFFTPDGGWTWYAIEFDGDDTFFGLVDGLECELGDFSLSELLNVRGALGLPVERDRFFKPTPVSKLQRWRRR